jgi:hypothetical protein
MGTITVIGGLSSYLTGGVESLKPRALQLLVFLLHARLI